MSAFAATDEDTRAIGRINGALRGPVTDIFRQIIPDLRARTRRDAYERIMNSPHMASTCFREFRARPDLFRTLVAGPNAVPLTNDEQMLSCGRTLAQVIALVVRAVAKRYFRARLVIVHRSVLPQKAKSPGLFSVVFGAFKAPPPQQSVRKEYSRADALYQALRAYLLFEWQVGLIPHYVSLPVSLVNELGPRILEYRDIEQVEALARSAKAAETQPFPENILPAFATATPVTEQDAMPPVSSLPPGLHATRPSSAAPSKIDILRSVSRRFGLAPLFGLNESNMHHLLDVVDGPARPVLAALAQASVAPPEAMVAAACMAHRIGPLRFENLMNSVHTATFLKDLSNQARDQNVKSLESAAEIQQAINRILDQLMRNYAKNS